MEWMNVFFNPRFVASVWRGGDIPAAHAPVVAGRMTVPIVGFAGRSNAGKSSLINALCNAKTAKVSRVPGKTRMINIFQINARLLADMPGYGYAKVPLAEKQGWEKKMRAFLPNVAALVLVVDCRRGIGDMDEAMLADCQRENINGDMIKVVVALTKADKLSRTKLLAAETRAREVVGEMTNIKVLPVSATTGTNIPTLRAILTKETTLR